MKKFFSVLAILFFIFSLVTPAFAATWNGGGADSNWTTDNNWGGTAPVPPDSLEFGGSVQTNNSNDFAADTQFNGITFAADAGTFTLNGNDINLGGNITNSSSNSQTINLNLSLQQETTVDAGAGRIVTMGGTLSGDQNLILAGTGRLILTGTNTYSGTTTVSDAGYLRVDDGGSLGSGDIVLDDSMAHLEIYRGGLTVGNAISGAGYVWVNNSSTDAVILTGANSGHSGMTYIQSGSTLQIGDGGIVGTLGSGIVMDHGTLTFNRIDDVTVANSIQGGGSVKKEGTNTLTISGANTYFGATTINGGTLVVSANGALGGTGGATTVSSGATLGFSGVAYSTAESVTINGSGADGVGAISNMAGGGSSSFAGAIALGSSSTIGSNASGVTFGLSGNINNQGNLLTFDGAGATVVTGTISGEGGLTKNGTGNLTLQHVNEYGGDTTVNAGTLGLNINGGATLGTSSSLMIGDGIGGADADTLILYFSNQISDTASVAVNNSGHLALNGSSDTIGSLSLTGGHVSTGAGTLTLGGDVTGSADAANATITGNLNLGGTTRNFNIADGAAGDDMSISAVITNGGLIKEGAGTLMLSGVNTYTGTTTISAGTLQVGAGGTTGNLGTGAVTNNSALVFNVEGPGGVEVTIANTISGAGSVSFKKTAATFRLTGDNTYEGTTTIGFAGGGGGSVQMYMGDGGDHGSFGSGDVVNYGTLYIARDGSVTPVTIANNISGTGTVNLLYGSTGTTIFTGSNSYSGDAYISGGLTMQIGNGGTNGTLGSGQVINHGILAFDRSNDILVGNYIYSDGAVRKSGAGALTLTNGNNYSGGTILNDGTLNINHATAIGTGALTINGGTIDNTSGTGLTLTHNNAQNWNADFTFTGTNDLSFGTGSVSLSATRQVTVADGVLTLGGAISGLGSGLTKAGAGTLALSGANTYTGDTSVNAGTLALFHASTNNLSGSTDINVASGAELNVTGLSGGGIVLANGQTLSGGGTVTGGVTVSSGSAISPGSSPGTLSTVGAVTYAGGATYAWEMNNATGTGGADPGWDLHNITGGLNITATSDNTFTIDIKSLTLGNVAGTAANFNSSSSYTWTIANASAGITGFVADKFTLATADFANEFSGTFSLALEGNALKLIYTGTGGDNSYRGAAAEPNGEAVGSVLDGIKAGGATGDMLNVLNTLDGLSNEQRGNALETMTPDMSSGSAEGSRALTAQGFSMVSNRLGGARSGGAVGAGVSAGEMLNGVGVWMQGLGSHMKQGERKGVEGYKANLFGTTIGADKVLDSHFRAGFAGSYGWARVKSKTAGSPSDDINSYQATLYGSFDSLDLCKARQGGKKSYEAVRSQVENSWYVDGMAAFTQNNYDSRREIWLGATKRVAKADHYGQQYSSNLEAGYKFVFEKTKSLEVTPFAGLGYNYLYMNKYKEKGADSLNLNVEGEGFHQLEQSLGTKLAYPLVNKEMGTFIPSIKAAWLYDYIGDRFESTASFAGGGTSFTTQGAKPARNGMLFGAELAFLNKGNVTLTGNWDMELKDQFMSNTYYGTVRYDF